MTVTDGDVVYRVWWDHTEAPALTHCFIAVGERSVDDELRDIGTAHLNPHDTCDRNKGRKVSLARALAQLNSTSPWNETRRARRKLFWAAYREQLGHW